MYFKFKCPSCSKSLKIREDLAGKKRTCPYCKTSVTIPDPSTVPQEIPAPVATSSSPGKTDSDDSSSDQVAVTVTPIRISAGDGKRSDPSDVSLFATFLVGIAGAGVLFVMMLPIKSTYLGNLFLGGGVQGIMIQFISSFMFFWALAILVLKHSKLKRQRNYMLMDVLPSDISEDITLGKLNQFADHIHDLPGDHSESYLITRVLRGLEHFRVRRSAAETVTMMSSQAEIDYNNVGSSYMSLKVLIWAIPIMGFVGTVLGISLAVGSLSGALSGSEDMSALKDSLQHLFSGLGTAFNTTLVALLMSMIIKFPMSSLQKSEDGLLNWVDEYCNENLLRRLHDGRASDPTESVADLNLFRKAVEEAMASQQSELEVWHEKMETVGKTISNQVMDGWDEINRKIIKTQDKLATQMLDQMQARAKEMSEQNNQQQVDLSERLDVMQDISSRLETSFSGMERGLTSLGNVLEKLGEEKIVIQQIEAPRKGWFGFGKPKRKSRYDQI